MSFLKVESQSCFKLHHTFCYLSLPHVTKIDEGKLLRS